MNMDQGLTSPVYSRDTIEFVTVANEFCRFIEESEQIDINQLVDKLHRLLPLLYLKATLLPVVEDSFEEYNEKFVTEEHYNFVHDILLRLFGDYDMYDEVFDPLRQENDEPAQLSVAESITDIYQDIKDFIMQFQVAAEEVMLNAIYECHQSFVQYWGQRTVNVLRVLHHLKYKVVELKTDENVNSSDDFNYDDVNTSNWLISRMQDDYNNEE